MPEHEASGAVSATLQSAVTELTRAFRQAGIDSPEQDARRLVAAAAGARREALLLTPDRPLGKSALQRLATFRLRRLAYEPVSRILGSRAFYGREFAVSPDTLDPRPETETLIEAALELVDNEGWRGRPLRILDIGTGSGCILATLLAELPAATGVGTDISPEALDMAALNAASVGVADRARFELRRSLGGIEGAFDLVVSNPPYIPSAEIAGLDPDVRDYDPRRALDGGPDGLDIYRELAVDLHRIVPEGWALLEVGAGQAAAVVAMLVAALGTTQPNSLRHWPDLGGHTRCVAVKTQL